MALASRGVPTILIERYAWLGGQISSQAVPPDEHPWIERLGRTALYAEFRRRLHQRFATEAPLFDVQKGNPGQAWVSSFTIEPRLAAEVLESWLAEYSRTLTILRPYAPIAVTTNRDRIESVQIKNLETGETSWIKANWVLEASETGELLPLAGAEYSVGAESRAQTGEPHAPEVANPMAQQAITWVMALTYTEGEDWTIPKPEAFDYWRDFQPPHWPGPLLSWTYPSPRTGEAKSLPLFGEGMDWWSYRRVRFAAHFPQPEKEISLVNWPQNDQMTQAILDVPANQTEAGLRQARELSLSLLYWMQTEAGFPGLRLDPQATGTPDGLAMAPYIRESRRILSLRPILEQHVSAELNPGLNVAPSPPDSVGVGAYRIDLHPTATGDPYLDLSSLPFEIPLGSLIPVRLRNLVAAGKAMGSTHITNGCTRLHPVEWNVGESAGHLIAFCLQDRSEPHQVASSPTRITSFQASLMNAGVEIFWPEGEVGPL